MFDHLMLNMMDHLESMERLMPLGPQPVAMTGYRSSQRNYFDPKRNRHTGDAHEHKREIARNLKRAARA